MPLDFSKQLIISLALQTRPSQLLSPLSSKTSTAFQTFQQLGKNMIVRCGTSKGGVGSYSSNVYPKS